MSKDFTLPSDQCFRALIEHSNDVIVLLTAEGTVIYASPSTERVTGYRPEELVGRNAKLFLHPDDLEDIQQRLSPLLDQPGNAITVEYRLSLRDGSWRWMEATLMNLLHDPAVEAVVCYSCDIAQRKQEQERLQQSEERYRVLVEEAGVGLFVADRHDQYVEVNEMGCQLSGYSREELLTMHIRDLVSEEDQTALPATLARMRSGKFQHNQWRMKRKDGSLLPVGMTGNLLSTGHLLAIVHDLSNQMRAEEARQQRLAYEQAVRAEAEAEAARARLHELFMQAPATMMILRGPQHRLEFANLRVRQPRGLTDLVGRTFLEVWPELGEQGALAILDGVYTSGTPFIGAEFPVWVHRERDGTPEDAWYTFACQALRTPQGAIEGLLVHAVEVTEQVQARRRVEELNRQLEAEKQIAEQAQHEAEARAAELSAIFEAITDGVLVCDAQAEIRYINAAFRSMLALEEDADSSQLQFDKRMEWLALRDSEGRPLPREQFATVRLLQGERLSGVDTTDFLCRTRKGADIVVNVSGAPIRGASGQIVGAVIVLRDVTERRSLERQLQESERKFHALVESNIFGVLVADVDGRVYELNDRVVQMVGYSKEELLAENFNWQHLVPPEWQEAQVQITRTLLSRGAHPPTESEYLRKDGSRLPVLAAATLLDQERRHALGVVLDISERKELERRKQEFLSMVNHELRTPLTVILGSMEIVLLHLEVLRGSCAPETAELLTQLEDVLTRARGQVEIEARLVDELLDISRLETYTFEVAVQQTNLVAIVQEAVRSWQQAAPLRDIELVLPSEERVLVRVDAGRIGQVLTNYLTNALKYAPAEQPIGVHLEVEASVARVSVRDQGPGLTPEQQQRVWERFYQAAAPGLQGTAGGLGLGLAIAKVIIEKHHGHVGVESAPGQGATFWFTVPLADELIPAPVSRWRQAHQDEQPPLLG